MSDGLLNINHNLKITALIVLVVGYFVYEQKPSQFFTSDGKFKNFGLKQNETPFPYFIMLMIVGFLTYYCLLLKDGKYV